MDGWLRRDIIEELLSLNARCEYLTGLLEDDEDHPGDSFLSLFAMLQSYQENLKLVMATNLSDILEYLNSPQPKFLGFETAVCWVLESLLEGDTYPTVLITSLENSYPDYKLSETVLQKAISFLDEQGVLTCYTQRTNGRGRPRRMLSLNKEYHNEALALTKAFQNWAL